MLITSGASRKASPRVPKRPTCREERAEGPPLKTPHAARIMGRTGREGPRPCVGPGSRELSNGAAGNVPVERIKMGHPHTLAFRAADGGASARGRPLVVELPGSRRLARRQWAPCRAPAARRTRRLGQPVHLDRGQRLRELVAPTTASSAGVDAFGGVSPGRRSPEALAQRPRIAERAVIESARLCSPACAPAPLVAPAVALSYPLVRRPWFARAQFASLHSPGGAFLSPTTVTAAPYQSGT